MSAAASMHASPDRGAVLVIDDSAVARAVIGRAIEGNGRLSVAGSVPTVGAALAFLDVMRVDAIVLDLNLPGIDGLTALPDLLAASGGAPVLVVSSACDAGTETTLRALALGAAGTLMKPGTTRFGGAFGQMLEERLLGLIGGGTGQPTAARSGPTTDPDFDVIAIGASTGGIHALSRLLANIGSDATQPIIVTQHLPATFMPYFADQIALIARRPCAIATESVRLTPGRILVAPGEAHVRLVRTVEGAAIRLSQEPAPSGCRPSVDPMLDTAASVFGPRALAIVLSGMGRDGALGAASVAKAGGTVVVQDRESSVIWGMPGVIAEAGLANAILPPEQIGGLIAAGRRPC